MSTLSVERPKWWKDQYSSIFMKTVKMRCESYGSFDIRVLDEFKKYIVKMSTRRIEYNEKHIMKFWETIDVDKMDLNEQRMLREFDYKWLILELIVSAELLAASQKPFDLDYYNSAHKGPPVMCGDCLSMREAFVVALNKDINQPRCARCGSSYIYQFTRELSESEYKQYQRQLGDLFYDATLEYSKKEDWKKRAYTLREETGLQESKRNQLFDKEEAERYDADPNHMIEFIFPNPISIPGDGSAPQSSARG